MTGVGNGDLQSFEEDFSQYARYQELMNEPHGGWFVLYESPHGEAESSVLRFSYLASHDATPGALEDNSWDLTALALRPSTSIEYDGDTRLVYYEQPANYQDFQQLVLVRDVEGPLEPFPELSEDFRLFWNLFNKSGTPDLYRYNDLAAEELVAKVSPTKVEVHARYLLSYLAIRQWNLFLVLDSIQKLEVMHELKDPVWQRRDGESNFDYWWPFCTLGETSLLRGKRLISCGPQEKSGVWPFEETKRYEEFIFAVNDSGESLTSTGSPDVVGYGVENSIGAHYLSPIFFRRDVLGKYLNDDTRYRVEDGVIFCTGSWSLKVDNNSNDYVAAFLGDLGSSLPSDEQSYWKSFNIEAGSLSETEILRSIYGEFADPEEVILRFKAAFATLCEMWTKKFGWSLFKPLNSDDSYVLNALHVPFQDSQQEFDMQLLFLAKTLVDSINEEKLNEIFPKFGNEQPLERLQRYLESIGIGAVDVLFDQLRVIQGGRSKGAVHRKSSDYDFAKIVGPSISRVEGFRKLLEVLVLAINELCDQVASN